APRRGGSGGSREGRAAGGRRGAPPRPTSKATDRRRTPGPRAATGRYRGTGRRRTPPPGAGDDRMSGRATTNEGGTRGCELRAAGAAAPERLPQAVRGPARVAGRGRHVPGRPGVAAVLLPRVAGDGRGDRGCVRGDARAVHDRRTVRGGLPRPLAAAA